MKKEENELSKGFSRKRFLGQAATVAAGFMIVPRHVLGGKGYTAPSDKLNMGCIGIGGKGRVDVNGVSSENIIALCDVDQERATTRRGCGKNAYEAFPDAKRYEDFREMLEKEKDIDAVTISTPDHTHAIITLTAMKMGKHVYTQKPLTRTIGESRKITEYAKNAAIATQMGNQGHANEGPRILNELIWQGAIGKVNEVHCWTNRPVWPQGIENRPTEAVQIPSSLNWDLWLGPASYRHYHPDYVPFNWRGWWDFGCGALGDMGCHIMDYPFWALDLSAPLTVEASSTAAFKESLPRASLITYKFDSGLDGSPADLIWYDGGLKPNIPDGLESEAGLWESGIGGVVFVGESGTLVYGHHRPKPALIIDGIEKDYDMPEEKIKRSIGHYMEWINEIKGGESRAKSNFDYAGPLNEAVLLGNVAIRTGKKLLWDSNAMKVTNLPEANQYLWKNSRSGWEL